MGKIYTKKGDKGNTSLFYNTKISKTNPLISLLAECDELNSFIGAAVAFSRETYVKKALEEVQNDLFIIQAELAMPRNKQKNKFHMKLTEHNVLRLEDIIDKLSRKLSFNSFVFPGGTRAGAFLHIARTIARKTEINVVKYCKKNKCNSVILRYFNRLSDFIYILARFENRKIKEKKPRY